MLSGPLFWAAQFSGAYIIASVFPGTEIARWLVGLLTIACGAAAGLLLINVLRQRRADADAFDTWVSGIAGMGQALAIVAIAYQGLPALLS
ncbi:hypothetical protein [Parafrankia sp. BMG5.11]|uniref:hypothetical protein n=1 Tax=Parafrankia sp. BMG5.11 TaxID=222540 RepID=UPI00103F0EB2|nr:hypothetical protein [Parafrankia sp. BMG5.11]TCJ39538.1 hypothetical protein E0504_10575 [Parafrankia sp. BMG5.11]